MFTYLFSYIFRHDAHPSECLELLKSSNKNKKTLIEEIGFGSLLQLQCTKIDHGLCLWLVNSFNLYSCTLKVYKTCIKLSPIDVEFIMELKARELKIDINKYISNKNDLFNKYCDKNELLSLVVLENQIREDREGGNDFKVRFLLLVLSVLLCPTMKLFVIPYYILWKTPVQ